MFTILTKPISWKYYYLYLFKRIIKYILFSRTYGPNSVVESLLQWLKELSVTDYNINPSVQNISETVYVPVGKETLLAAISLKRAWKIKRIIAWPNITIPESVDDIFFDPLIDFIIVPSVWVKNYFLSLCWPTEKRIIVAPAGVETYAPSKRSGPIIIYKKECPTSLFHRVERYLNEINLDYVTIEYGRFQKSDYLNLLDTARGVIYLQTSESQWLALHEAWMKNVPTLVWNRGYWEYKKSKWFDPMISAPYLTEVCGMFFEEKNFLEIFPLFMNQLWVYSPREYSKKYFTNSVTTRQLLSSFI